MVLSTGNGVNGFLLDPAIGEFVLTDPNMRVRPRGNIYYINEGYTNNWDKSIQEYVALKKQVITYKYFYWLKFHNALLSLKGAKPYGARYVGSMVADVHRTLKYGGIFMYPATKDAPQGKVKTLFYIVYS